MADYVVDNFKYGLDTRRSELTSIPGTLETLINGHINQGGEIEKRKAFVRTALPTNSFGLERTSSGPTAFGSVASGSLTIPMPAGYSYQRLQHPDGSTAMTSVVSSSSFGGKAWVIAKFADGNVYGYYDGTLVYDFTNGLVIASLNTNVKIAAEMVKELNRTTLYTGTQQPNPNDNQFNAFGALGSAFSVTTTKVTAAGTLTNSAVAAAVQGLPGAAASGQFSIIAGTNVPGTNKITKVEVNAVDILIGAVNYQSDPTTTATAVAAQINGAQNNYVATAAGNTVTITALTSAGATPNGFDIHISAAGNVCCWNCPITFALATGGTSFNVNTIFVDGIDVLAGTPVPWTTDLLTTIAAVATAIVTNSGTTNYTAVAINATLYISSLSTHSTDIPRQVTVNLSNTQGGVFAGGTSIPIAAVITPSVINRSRSQSDATSATCLTFSGTPPFKFAWSPQGTGSSGGFFARSPNGQTTSFGDTVLDSGGGTGYWVCTITDAVGLTAVSNVLAITFPPL